MTSRMAKVMTTRRWGRLAVGWVLLVLGVAALVLPGPGLLMIFAGLAVLSQQYLWARRRLAPARVRALKAAAASVRSGPTIAFSVLVALCGVSVGVLWGLRPDPPGWWPLDERWWLPGGWGTGSSMIISGCIALTLIAVSYRHFRDVGDGADPARTPARTGRGLPDGGPGRSSAAGETEPEEAG